MTRPIISNGIEAQYTVPNSLTELKVYTLSPKISVTILPIFLITFDNCKKCLKFEPHSYKPIKKKTNKLNRMERNRYSILTNNLDICWVCKMEKDLEIPRDDLHEIYPRQK